MKKVLMAFVLTTVFNSIYSQSWDQNGNTVGAEKTIGTIDTFSLPFIVNNLERMRLNTSGNLGIATSSPLARLHIIKDAIGASQSDGNGLLLQNTTAATSTVMQASPPIVFSGRGWKSNATAESQEIKFMLDVLPSVNTANTGGAFRLQRSINGAAYGEVFSVGNTSNSPGVNLKLNGSNFFYSGNGLSIVYGSSTGSAWYNQSGNVCNMIVSNNSQMILGGNQMTFDASVWLDVKGTSGVYKGFLTPRMTTAQRNGITTPATGLEIYNTDTNTKDIYNGTAWVSLAAFSSIPIPTLQQVTTAGKTTTDTITVGGMTCIVAAKIDSVTVGRGAGRIATNTVVGMNALSANTTGVFNTAVGDSTLVLVTTGTQNTAIGSKALKTVVTGLGNTAVGAGALMYNTASSNTAVGGSALISNTTGTYNAALGAASLYANTTGTNNAALGYWALRFNTTGNENTAFGTTALRENTTGNKNIGLGRQALSGNTTGSNKIGIGYQAGFTNNGDGNIFIGYQAGYSESGSNKLYISNSSTSAPLIYGDFASTILAVNGSLGVGTQSPTAQLHTTGSVRFTGLTSNDSTNNIVVIDSTGRLYYRASTVVFGNKWGVTGNSGTNPSINFIGTTDNTPVVIRTNNTECVRIDSNGNVGIGTIHTNDSAYRLFVEKGIHTRKIKVDGHVWADYVFEKDYVLLPLKEVEKYIEQNKHLPGVASAEEIKKKGLDLGDNQVTLLKKIEELTLYIIDQNKQLETQQKTIDGFQKELEEVKKSIPQKQN